MRKYSLADPVKANGRGERSGGDSVT
jgi:hypothetical protein